MAKAALKLLGTARAWASDVREGVLKRPDGAVSSVLVRVGPEPATPEALARGRASVALLARVGDESVLPLEAVVSAGGILARVYTRVEAVSAQRVLELCRTRAQVVPARVAVVLAAAVAKALGAIYALEDEGWRGAHVGCGPEQLLLRRDGSIRLAGATVEGAGGRVEGRAGYRPPEGGTGGGTYMVGALLVELLTGEPPPQADADRARHDQAVRRAVIRVLARPGDNPGETVGRLLQRVLAYDPAARGSVTELAEYLGDLAARLPGVGPAAWLPDVIAAVVRALPPEPSTPPAELGITDSVPSDIPIDGTRSVPPRQAEILRAPSPVEPEDEVTPPRHPLVGGAPTWSGEVPREDTEDLPPAGPSAGPGPWAGSATGPSGSRPVQGGPGLVGPGLAGPGFAGPMIGGPPAGATAPRAVGSGAPQAGPPGGGARGPMLSGSGPVGPRAVRIEPLGGAGPGGLGDFDRAAPSPRGGGSVGLLTAVATVCLASLLVAGGVGIWWKYFRVGSEAVETMRVGEPVGEVSGELSGEVGGVPGGEAGGAPASDPAAGAPVGAPVGVPAGAPGGSTAAVPPAPVPVPSPPSPPVVTPAPSVPAAQAATARLVAAAPTARAEAPVTEPTQDVGDPDEPVRISGRAADPAPAPAAAPAAPPAGTPAPVPVVAQGPFRVSFAVGDPSVNSLDVRCTGASGAGSGPVVLDGVERGTTCKITGSGTDAPLLALVTVNADRSYTCFRSRSRTCQ